MADDARRTSGSIASQSGHIWLVKWLFTGLWLVGTGLAVTGAIYFTSVQLNTWLLSQDRYLVGRPMVPLLQGGTAFAEEPILALKAQAMPSAPQQTLAFSGATATPSIAQPGPTSRPSSERTAQPVAQPTSTAEPPAPIRLRIPAIRVDRSIIEVPLTYDERTRIWTRDLGQLFRGRGKDLVGHWGGSAYPGQAGNTILVGHNFGYGYNGVFVYLGRLKAGAEISIVDSAGRTYV
jgi:hypothetical protein